MKEKSNLNGEIFDFYRKLDRRIFLDDEYKQYADVDQALPIGYEQTISQPSLVLEMTIQLQLNKKCKVLEIGTGSGYQTALLAQFAQEVYTIERIEDLSRKAQERLTRLGYQNIKFKIGDGSEGWPEFAPYNRIIVTAGAGRIPQELIEQLAVDGRMVLPVGEPGLQELVLVEKDERGNIKREPLGEVRFVPLVGKYSY
ncbi:MAG: protein-L-isoaspartate(D-aspartate) O-methyltransferase [Clostridia bacterium]|jgi:protein-L-isoaspartate(D-aspartate) O-methyltransferase|nr:protein-L-isoaspartate(D-aspartate) O-methyltransferase [Clostridia bacterium]MDN5322617.1 protein-L-isoaspartate(D-aspartate) O-methyltransferase [Clostridia bacterium]